MKMNLVMEIRDAPGQLVSILDPIRGLGANIVTVIHKRDEKTLVFVILSSNQSISFYF